MTRPYMTLEEFRASGRDVENLDDHPHDLAVEGPGRVYCYDGGPHIERWTDDRFGKAPPNGPTWLLTIGNESWEGELAKLEEILYEWAIGEEIIFVCRQHTDTGRGVCADCGAAIPGSPYA